MAHFVKMSDGKYFFAPSMRYLKGLAQAQHSSMTRYWAVWGAILAFLLVGFLVAEALDVPLLADPIPWLTRGGLLGAILAVALLTVDAVLPVPASLVVVAAGALYGTVTGAFLALLGRVLMALAGYAIGQRGGPLVAQLVPRNGRDRADGLLRRWGVMAIVLTRPMPLLAETVTILAGVSSIGWGRVALAALVGSVPEAIVYAASGALAHSVEEAALVWVALLILACTLWSIRRWADRHPLHGYRQPDQHKHPRGVRSQA